MRGSLFDVIRRFQVQRLGRFGLSTARELARSDTNQVGVTSMVARSSAGAVNHLPIVRTENLPAAIETLKESGVSIIGASEKSATPVNEHTFYSPTLLILGNEGSGIREDLLEQCDARLSINQSGQVGSLNVAAAAAILFHEARRERS